MAEQLIDAAIVVFVFTAAWVLRRLTRTEPDQQPPAEHAPAHRQLIADLAAYRALRKTGLEQEPGDPYSDDRIELELMFIPRQRTEDHR